MDEAQTLRRAMLGDAPALEALIETYYSGIYAFCCRRVGNQTLGADVCQDAFLKMVQHLPAYREQGRFKSWLFTIAANCCRDALRKKRPTAELNDALPDERASGFERAAENAQLVRTALNALPEAQREAVILRYYHDFTVAEMARVQQVPQATVKTRLHRGLKKMRETLGEGIILET